MYQAQGWNRIPVPLILNCAIVAIAKWIEDIWPVIMRSTFRFSVDNLLIKLLTFSFIVFVSEKGRRKKQLKTQAFSETLSYTSILFHCHLPGTLLSFSSSLRLSVPKLLHFSFIFFLLSLNSVELVRLNLVSFSKQGNIP